MSFQQERDIAAIREAQKLLDDAANGLSAVISSPCGLRILTVGNEIALKAGIAAALNSNLRLDEHRRKLEMAKEQDDLKTNFVSFFHMGGSPHVVNGDDRWRLEVARWAVDQGYATRENAGRDHHQYFITRYVLTPTGKEMLKTWSRR